MLRGELNAAQYIDYILGLLFLKRMNDQFELEQVENKEEFGQMGLPKEGVERIRMKKFINSEYIYYTSYGNI
nr:type I restriction-modification system subunit M N-terminal domain-containing protein [Paeniclostridium sordellii]